MQHHIVKLYSLNEYATLPEISLEYIQEPSLRQNHVNHILSVLEYKKFAKQALDALCYLHGRRTACRGLRLDTVIVQRRNPIHIKVAVDTTSDAEFLRTYDKNYLAPEVMERGICGRESDIWALGVMGMELFSGIEIGHHGLHNVQLQFSIGEKRWHICQYIENMTLPDPRLRWPARQLLRKQENDANDSLPALENGNLIRSSFSSPHEAPKVGNSVTSPQDNSMPDTAPGTPSFNTEITPTAIAAIAATDSMSSPEEQTVPVQPSHQSMGPTDRPSDRELRARRRAARKALG
ncbi:hypothetical protein J3459_011890 [Metarhizium acridum]|nr:hypothetical protein J3459_011890 [Metarhizium acridum]